MSDAMMIEEALIVTVETEEGITVEIETKEGDGAIVETDKESEVIETNIVVSITCPKTKVSVNDATAFDLKQKRKSQCGIDPLVLLRKRALPLSLRRRQQTTATKSQSRAVVDGEEDALALLHPLHPVAVVAHLPPAVAIHLHRHLLPAKRIADGKRDPRSLHLPKSRPARRKKQRK